MTGRMHGARRDDDPQELEAGVRSRFGQEFEILEKLGEGGMGAVFRVRRGSDEFALKLLVPWALTRPGLLERFILEGEILQALQHPNVMRVEQVGKCAGWPYMLCELVDGGTLADQLDHGALDWKRAFDLCAGILDGLAASHARKVIHRDIKPANILLTRDDRPKLADFGIAKAEGGFHSRKTTTGVVVGTPAYIAPEVLRGDEPGPRSDVFAVGVMLHELIAGEPPWHSHNVHDLVNRRFDDGVPPLADRIPGVSRSVDVLLQTALAANPVDRFPTAATFRMALIRTRQRIEQCESPSSPAPRSAASSRPSRPLRVPETPVPPRTPVSSRRPVPPPRSSPLLLVGVVAVQAVIAIAGFAHFRGRPGVGVMESTSVEQEDATGQLQEAESRFVDEVVKLAASGTTARVLETKLAGVDSFPAERRPVVFGAIWRIAPESARPLMVERSLAWAHPWSVPAILWVLGRPPVPGSDRRERAAAALLEVVKAYPDPAAHPATGFARIQLESLLETAVHGDRDESPSVVRAAIRYLGWLGSPATSAGCIDAMVEAPLKVGWSEFTLDTTPRKELLAALRRIPTTNARTTLTQLEKVDSRRHRREVLAGTEQEER